METTAAEKEAQERVKVKKPPKICPLLSAGKNKFDYCITNACAWFDINAKCCVIQIMAWEA